MTKVTRWWWIRHAPVLVEPGVMYGQQDLPCDCTDVPRFKALAAVLPPQAPCLVTPLRRTRETAAALVTAGWQPGPETVVEAFKEQNFGQWQGQRYDQLDNVRDSMRRNFWYAPAFERAPQGESFAELAARVIPAILALSREHAGRDIVAVTHGGVMRAALMLALGLPVERALAFSVPNCALTVLDHIRNGDEPPAWRVNNVNWEPQPTVKGHGV